MIRHGTRMPRPRKSSCGGAALSYQPPQSSQSRMIADVFQYGLSPIAFTTLATQEGPRSLWSPGWSESGLLGVTKLTDARLLLPGSVRIVVCGEMMLRFQS